MRAELGISVHYEINTNVVLCPRRDGTVENQPPHPRPYREQMRRLPLLPPLHPRPLRSSASRQRRARGCHFQGSRQALWCHPQRGIPNGPGTCVHIEEESRRRNNDYCGKYISTRIYYRYNDLLRLNTADGSWDKSHDRDTWHFLAL